MKSRDFGNRRLKGMLFSVVDTFNRKLNLSLKETGPTPLRRHPMRTAGT